jgi:hypothetical protein
MDLSQKSKDLNRSEWQSINVNLSGLNSNLKPREFTNSLLVNSLLKKERVIMSISVKASEYQKVLDNHLNAVETTLRGAGIKDKAVIDNGRKEAEAQFRLDYNATGGKHEDFFSPSAMNQLKKVQIEVDKLNAMNPTGKGGVAVTLGTICKKA